jgi:uncharacterized protein
MKVLPDIQCNMICTYRGNDKGLRSFDILIDGERDTTQSLNINKPDEFFDFVYPLPVNLTKGKKKLLSAFNHIPGILPEDYMVCEL